MRTLWAGAKKLQKKKRSMTAMACDSAQGSGKGLQTPAVLEQLLTGTFLAGAVYEVGTHRRTTSDGTSPAREPASPPAVRGWEILGGFSPRTCRAHAVQVWKATSASSATAPAAVRSTNDAGESKAVLLGHNLEDVTGFLASKLVQRQASAWSPKPSAAAPHRRFGLQAFPRSGSAMQVALLWPAQREPGARRRAWGCRNV